MLHTTRLSVVALCAVLLSACGGSTGPLDAQLAPLVQEAGFEPVPQPAPEDPALVELGRNLFFDKILSGNRNISCATCHHPVAATGDALPVSIGQGGTGLAENRQEGTGELIPRNAPHVFNGGVEGVNTMFWDSRVSRDPVTGALSTPEDKLNGSPSQLPDITAHLDSALAAQAMFPVTSREEMRGHPGDNEVADAPDNEAVWQALMARLVGTANGTIGGFDGYRTLFQAAYPEVTNFDDFNFGHVARAIAAFERERWTALDTPFDRYMAGDRSALSDSEKRGARLFCEKAQCAQCHRGPLLTDFEHHALAVPQVGPGKTEPSEDRGLALETGDDADNYRFRTPPLRNVALTGPWMHDGAFTSLEAAVRHHLDAATSLASYDVTQLPPPFQGTVDSDPDRQMARLEALDPLLQTPIQLTEEELSDLMDFLHALTDPSSLNLLSDVPDSVPSGLPVED